MSNSHSVTQSCDYIIKRVNDTSISIFGLLRLSIPHGWADGIVIKVNNINFELRKIIINSFKKHLGYTPSCLFIKINQINRKTVSLVITDTQLLYTISNQTTNDLYKNIKDYLKSNLAHNQGVAQYFNKEISVSSKQIYFVHIVEKLTVIYAKSFLLKYKNRMIEMSFSFKHKGTLFISEYDNSLPSFLKSQLSKTKSINQIEKLILLSLLPKEDSLKGNILNIKNI